ncbi:hypothetical protein [Chondromyces apiculatus]|uniref:Uncharacterized protein n=1 Tax=Chondromyces apiculatus DSM 436 TaxID=1192034 RepID=A0A017TFU3_9BACT|nr:hypothetical protein [Chondromyces apiculatus]EYF08079.1 Hypothetical protein CAP_5839 [Chondromyces apiculatus DSM 436]
MDICPPSLDSPVFLYGLRRLLLLLHTAGSIVLLGAATHHAMQMRHYLRGRFPRVRQEKTWARVTSAAYVITFALGALLYPSYRVHVRACWLEQHAPLYVGLFDVKEVFASLALVVAVGLGLLSYTLRPAEERALVPVYAAMSFVVCAVVWLDATLGILIVSVRGIG